jgi:hypothetical protein
LTIKPLLITSISLNVKLLKRFFNSSSTRKELVSELNGAGEPGPENRPAYIPLAGRRNRTNGAFEPARGKGLVARASLYFLLAHQGFVDNSKYAAAGVETLKTWARSEPPTAYERNRSETVFEAQGKRNPLIGFPEWIDLIDFTRGVGSSEFCCEWRAGQNSWKHISPGSIAYEYSDH